MAAQIDSLIDENPPPVGLTEEQLDDHILEFILAQHSFLKKGIALFGDKAEQATTAELQAIHDMGTYEPLNVSNLTRDNKCDALELLLFLTEKRDGRIKSSKCAMRSKQRTYDGYDKSAGSSPTVTTKGLILTCGIDIFEGRKLAIGMG